MGPDGAVNIIHRGEIAAAGDDAEAVRGKFVEEYRETFANPWVAAELMMLETAWRLEQYRDTLAQILARRRAAASG